MEAEEGGSFSGVCAQLSTNLQSLDEDCSSRSVILAGVDDDEFGVENDFKVVAEFFGGGSMTGVNERFSTSVQSLGVWFSVNTLTDVVGVLGVKKDFIVEA